MIKKILLPLIFLVSISMGIELKLKYNDYTIGSYANGAIDVYVDHSNEDVRTDWIGVYKKGSSTEWKNVIKWRWVRDLEREAVSDDRTIPVFRDTHFVEQGEYVIRYFKNNSYVVDTSIDFKIKQVDSFLESVNKISQTQFQFKGFDEDKFMPNQQDWVGIYEEGDDNAWGNVVEWRWIKDLESNGHYGFMVNKNLYKVNVKYEARYFLNNSFDIFKKSKAGVVVPLIPEDNLYIINSMVLNDMDPEDIHLNVGIIPEHVRTSKDWIGVFQIGAQNLDLSTLVAWHYVNKRESNYDLKIIKPELLHKHEIYRAVFFRDDGYIQLGQSHTVGI